MAILTWFGQAGFTIESRTTRIAIDLFLSETEDARPPVTNLENIGNLNAISVTHEHIDHFDESLLREMAHRHDNLQVIVPPPLVDRTAALGFNRSKIIEAHVHEPIHIGELTMIPIPSCHGVSMTDAYHLGNPLGQFVGYVVMSEDLVVYHSGDTIKWSDIETELSRYGIHVALLPINGRDSLREEMGIVGNLTPEEAVDVAHRIGARVLVPMHFDGFAKNPGSPETVISYARQFHPDLSVVVMGYLNPLHLSMTDTPGRPHDGGISTKS